MNNGTSLAIDLTISSVVLAPTLSWETSSDLHNSDHCPIFITNTCFYTNADTKCIKRWLLDRANWVKYKNACNLTNLNINQEIDSVIHQLNDTLISAATESVPQSSGKVRKKTVPWWCPQIKDAIENRNKALKKFRITRLQIDLSTFRLLRAKARRLILSKKRESWQQFLNSINSSSTSAQLWRKIKSLQGKISFATISEIRHEDELIQEPSQIANTFATFFASASATSQYSPSFQQYKQQAESQDINISSDNEEWFNADLTLEELRTSLKSFKKNKTPGPDNIPLRFLSEIKTESMQVLLSVFNKIWKEGSFPSVWSSAIVIPLLKQGKNKFETTSYRPIALTCIPCKVLEKIIANRLSRYLENSNFLASAQCGFRRQRSTQDQVLNLTADIHTTFSNNKNLYTIFFDIQKAYDRTWRYYILQQLVSAGIKGRSTTFIKNYLSNRTIQVRINRTLSQKVIIENGVPQGGVMSIICFLLAINGIGNTIPKPIKCRLFADDLNISLSTNDTIIAETLLQAALHNLQTWSDTVGLQFSPEKCKCMLFTRKRNFKYPELYLQDVKLPFVNKHTFLGVTFDPKITWLEHLKDIRCRALKNLIPLKMIRNRHFGPTHSKMLNIYRTLVRSVFDYGCIAYSSASPTMLKILDSVHNSGIRLALCAFPTSPLSTMQFLCDEPPLSIRRAYIALAYHTKIKQLENHINYPVYYSNTQNTVKQFADEWKQKIALHTENPKPLEIKNKIYEYWAQTITETEQRPLLRMKTEHHSWLQKLSEVCDHHRSTTTAILRVYIGHTALTHRHLLLSEEPPLCDVCLFHPALTLQHVLLHCTKYDVQRDTFLKNVTSSSYLCLRHAESILNFLSASNLLNML